LNPDQAWNFTSSSFLPASFFYAFLSLAGYGANFFGGNYAIPENIGRRVENYLFGHSAISMYPDLKSTVRKTVSRGLFKRGGVMVLSKIRVSQHFS